MLFPPHMVLIYHENSEKNDLHLYLLLDADRNYFCEKYVSSKTTQPKVSILERTSRNFFPSFFLNATNHKMQGTFKEWSDLKQEGFCLWWLKPGTLAYVRCRGNRTLLDELFLSSVYVCVYQSSACTPAAPLSGSHLYPHSTHTLSHTH